MDAPAFYTPDNEPYLGCAFLRYFDEALVSAEADCRALSGLTEADDLTSVEVAVIELVPTTLSIGFSIRELIRQAYIPSARILMRPLLEHAATVDYVVNEPGGIDLWTDGWKRGVRPGFANLVARMTNTDPSQFSYIHAMTDDFNSVVHAEPTGSRKFAFPDPLEGRHVYSLSRSYGAVDMVENIASAGAMAVTFLASNAKRAFRNRVSAH